jgi:hypothetical protein
MREQACTNGECCRLCPLENELNAGRTRFFTAAAQQATSNKQKAKSKKQQATSNKQQATSSKQQATSSKQQAASNKQQAASNKQCMDGCQQRCAKAGTAAGQPAAWGAALLVLLVLDISSAVLVLVPGASFP